MVKVKLQSYKIAFVMAVLVIGLFAVSPEPVSAPCVVDSNCPDDEYCSFPACNPVVGCSWDWVACNPSSCTGSDYLNQNGCGSGTYCQCAAGNVPTQHMCVGCLGGCGVCSSCPAPLADCNSNGGCETNLASSGSNCGSCGNNCAAKANYCSSGKEYKYTGSCSSGTCTVTNLGYTNGCCSASSGGSLPNACADGCHNFQTDWNNCGSCGNDCTKKAAYCSGGKSYSYPGQCTSGVCATQNNGCTETCCDLFYGNSDAYCSVGVCNSPPNCDRDGDGYRDANNPLCNTPKTDCNDDPAAGGASIYPGAPDNTCNNIDNNCNGVKDEGYVSVSCGGLGVCSGTTSCSAGVVSCSSWNSDCGTCCKCSGGTQASPSSAADLTQNGDCSATVCPVDGCGVGGCGAHIYGDFPVSVANSCSGVLSCTSNSCSASCQTDADGDGYSVSCGDCNDNPAAGGAAVYPGASDANCDSVDNNCNGMKDEGYVGVSCGSGSCSGTTSCSAGVVSCSSWNSDCGTCCKCSGGTQASPSSAADLTQNGDCSATVCPVDGCGVGGCGAHIYGDFPVSVANSCSGVLSCTSNSCSASCESDADGDAYSASCGDCNIGSGAVYPGSCQSAAISWPSTCAQSTTGGCGTGTCTRSTNGAVCGTTDCDYLDTTCRNYHDVSDTCSGGGCTPASCGGSYTDASSSTACDSSTRICNAGQNKYCSGGNIYADTDVDKTCITYCTGSGSCGAGCTPSSCSAALWESCANTCSGETSASYFAADSPVIDKDYCGGGATSCPVSTRTDYCSGSMLTDYYCSGSDAASSSYNCDTSDYSALDGTCGTGINGCMTRDYSCSGAGNAYCAYVPLNLDSSSSACGAGGSVTMWLPSGESSGHGEYAAFGQVACCGDDSGEGRNAATPGCTDGGSNGCGANDFPALSAGASACCSTANDCVFGGRCYASNSVPGSGMYTDAQFDLGSADNVRICEAEASTGKGVWYDCDNNAAICTGAAATGRCGLEWLPSGGVSVGEYDSAGIRECCGDDSNEFGKSWVLNPSVRACCASSTDCVGSGGGCLPDGTYDSGYQCVSGSWSDCADNSQICCQSGGYEWIRDGKNGGWTCGGDDAGESSRIRWRQCSGTVCLTDVNDRALCSASTDCVMSSQCFDDVKTLVSSAAAEKNVLCSGILDAASCHARSQCLWTAGSCAARPATTTDVLLSPSLSGKAFFDVNADSKLEMCDPGEWMKSAGRLYGRVLNVTGKAVPGVLVELVGAGSSALTDASGYYLVESVAEGVYDLRAFRAPYASSFALQQGVYGETEVDFVLSHPSDLCEADCSYTTDDVCHADCHGRAGCGFESGQVQSVCDGQGVGFVKEVGGGVFVQCCSGVPYVKQDIAADVEIDAKNVHRVERIVRLPDGRLGKMVVYVFT